MLGTSPWVLGAQEWLLRGHGKQELKGKQSHGRSAMAGLGFRNLGAPCLLGTSQYGSCSPWEVTPLEPWGNCPSFLPR